ncbi:MAG: hypothetical protein Q7R70_03840 [Candidatus Diapherotrites archaeon]|nr:hypothetical protein [Candidatus Diapherotrites archaeon]
MPKPIKPRKIEMARRSLIRDYFRGNARKDIPTSEIKRVSELAAKLAPEKARYSAAMSTDLKEVRQRSQDVARRAFVKAHAGRTPARANARVSADLDHYNRNRHSLVYGLNKGQMHRLEDSIRMRQRSLSLMKNPTRTELERLQNMKTPKEIGEIRRAKKARKN